MSFVTYNYDIKTDEENPKLLLEDVTIPYEVRPHVGDIIEIDGQTGFWEIKRSEPTNNPNNQKVTYFVKPHQGPNTSWPVDWIENLNYR